MRRTFTRRGIAIRMGALHLLPFCEIDRDHGEKNAHPCHFSAETTPSQKQSVHTPAPPPLPQWKAKVLLGRISYLRSAMPGSVSAIEAYGAWPMRTNLHALLVCSHLTQQSDHWRMACQITCRAPCLPYPESRIPTIPAWAKPLHKPLRPFRSVLLEASFGMARPPGRR